MNEDHLSDRTAGLDDRAGGVADGSAVTRADQTRTHGAASGIEESGNASAADASGSTATLGGDSIGLPPDQTLADRSISGEGGRAPLSVGGEARTISGDVPIDPTNPDPVTIGEGVRAARPRRPRPTVPGYEILNELGRGGMGVVYLARQIRLNRLCALKMILAGDHASNAAALRFQTEAETIARLRHAHIAQIYHIGDCDGQVYFEMEFLEGGSLESKLNGTPWPAPRAAALVNALAKGVTHAHQLGIIHRDLKPGNILMDADGTPKIADFGLAKTLNVQSGLTQTDSILGSPSYMAPEQAGGHAKDVGPAADVYALGAILYDLLTGRPPFKAATLLETLEQVKTIEPVSPARLVPGLPRDIETICLKCLQKEPAKRYVNAAALEEDLRRYHAGEPILARRTGQAERAWRWCRRNKVMAGLVATLLLVLAGGFGATTFLWLRAERLRAEADESFRLARNAVDDYLTRVAESRLLGVPGLQPLRKELLESALPYYESFIRRRADDPALAHELASAYSRLAKINADLGRGPEALDGYRKALEVLSRRTGRPGDDDSRHQAEVARCHQAIGDVHRQAEDLPAALQSYRAAEAIWRKLTGLGPGPAGAAGGQPTSSGSLEQRDALAIVLDRIGSVHEKTGGLEKAVQSYGEAVLIEWGAVHSGNKPEDPSGLDHHLARMFTKLGDLQVEMHMQPDALRWVVGSAVTNTSDFGAGSGDRFPFYKRAETILARLIRELPTDARINDFRRDLADCREHNAGALLGIERGEEALSSYREALEIRRRLVRENPAVPEYQEGLARVEFESALLLDRGGKRTEALDLYRQVVEHQRMVVATSTGAVPPRRTLARQLARLGDAERHAGRPAQAMDDYREAGTLLDGLPRPAADDLYVLATLHAAQAGLAGQGKARLTDPERTLVNRSAGAAVEALSRAIDAGFEDHGRAFKDTALEPLRSRDDFKKQMARLAEIGKGPEWLTDLDAARRRAAEQGKDLFLYFSGSDWCPWCHLFKKSVLDRPAFARYAARNFVLVQFDDPQRSAQPPNAATRNALARKWKLYGVPMVILADARGRPYANASQSSGEEDRNNYTAVLERLRQVRAARDQALYRADAAQGVERARYLDEALSALKTLAADAVMADYADLISQIATLDPEDRTGLRAKYARSAEVAWKTRHDEVLEALKRRDWRGALAQCDAILAELKPTGQSAQETRVSRGLALEGLGKNAEAAAEFDRAVELDRKATGERRAAFDAAPWQVERRQALSASYSHLIRTLQKSGRSTEAVDIALQRRGLWPENPTELYNVACELALSVPASGPGPAAVETEAARRKIADQAVETLGRAVLAGFPDASWMTRDPDLEVLRARDDFRALVRSLRELGGPASPVSELRRFAGHGPNSLPTIVVLPDGRHLLTAGQDRMLRRWELETGREVQGVGTAGQVLALALSPDGRRALTGGIDKVLQLWDAGTLTERRRFGLDQNIISLAFSPDGQRGLAGLSDATIRLLDLDTGKELLRLEGHGAGAIRTVAFTPDGLRALSGGEGNSVRLWDLKSGRELRRLVEPRAMVWSLAFSPDGRRIAAGCDDGSVFVWNTSDWHEVRCLEVAADAVRSAAFLPDSRHVVSSHASGKLIVWDLDTGREVLRLHGTGNRPTLAVLADGRRVLTADAGGLIRSWSLDEELVRPRELDLLGRWAEAGAALDKSLRSRPDDPRLWILRARHDMLLGRWEQAAADFRKAIELARDDTGVLALVAGALQVAPPGPGEGAKRLLDSLDPKGPRAVTFWMKLERPILGVNGAPQKDGVSLMSIDPKGGAAAAGLQAGDVLFEVAGKPVVDPDSLRDAIKGRHAGDPVTVKFRRGTTSFSRAVTLKSWPIPFLARQDQSRQALDADQARFRSAGYRPAYITAYQGWRGRPTYAGLWLRDDRPSLVKVEATSDEFEKQARELPAGYRLDWLQISGDADQRRWSAVWVADPDRVSWEYRGDLGRAQLSQMIDRPTGQGDRPRMITAYRGPGEETRYAGVWIKDGTPFLAPLHLTAEELQSQLAALSTGWRPEWVNVYKEQGRRFYTAIFVKDEGRTEWQLTIDTPEWGMQTIFKKLSEEGFAPVLLDLE